MWCICIRDTNENQAQTSIIMAAPTTGGAGSSAGATIEQAFVSAGCNRSSGCGAWSLGLHAGVAGTEKEAAKGLVAYGACNLVALYDPVVRHTHSQCCSIPV